MTNAPVEFYYDFNSPYGYIGANLIGALAAKHGRDIAWKPILLGAVFKITGSGPLPEVPLKGDYAARDFERSAKFHGLPYRFPDEHPFSPVAASRAVYWAGGQQKGADKALTLALYDAVWVRNRSIASPEAVAEVAGEAGLFATEEVLAALQEPAVKQRLMTEVDAAIAKGVFGSPFVIVDCESFWGVDRFEQVDRWLETGGW